ALEREGVEVPEPDWAEFRSSVRDKLLSRSVQRQSSLRRLAGWTGWSINPAMAWALSLILAVGIPTGMFLWHLQLEKENAVSATVQQTRPLASPELIEVGTEKTVFNDVVDLTDMEQAQFQQLLEAARTGNQRLQ